MLDGPAVASIPEVQSQAYTRAVATLEKAAVSFGDDAEIQFWRRYIDYRVLGEPAFPDEAVALFERGSKSAAFYLFTSVGLTEYSSAAKRLYDEVRDGKSARKRYIAGILKSRVE